MHVAGRERRFVAESSIAKRHEDVNMLVARQIDGRASRYAGAPQDGVALMEADGALVTFAGRDRHQSDRWPTLR